MESRALSFGSVASSYEKFRPGYPELIVDQVLDFASGPVATALEIGAGTGKATREFAARGISVTASEPDPSMLGELRKHVPSSVLTVQSTFEELPLDRTYDLVFSAASMHWTSPEGRWDRVAALLVPGGVYANFGGPFKPVDVSAEALLTEVISEYVDVSGFGQPDGTRPDASLRWPATELSASPFFTDVRQINNERRLTLSIAEYLDHLSTISFVIELSAEQQAALRADIAAAMPTSIDIEADVTTHLARRI